MADENVVKRRKRDSSALIGTVKLAKLYDRSRFWAWTLMKEWLTEQENGGPVRVLLRGKQRHMYTTVAVLQRELPTARDQMLVRKVAELEKDLDTCVNRLNTLTTDVGALQRVMGQRR